MTGRMVLYNWVGEALVSFENILPKPDLTANVRSSRSEIMCSVSMAAQQYLDQPVLAFGLGRRNGCSPELGRCR